MKMKTTRVASGIAGLDDILGGGFDANRLYLVEGTPGVGKTTLAMQFLMEGANQGERCLYITLSETRDEMEAVASSHGWSLDGIDIIELSQVENVLGAAQQSTLFHPAEVELGRLEELIVAEFDRLAPRRMVLDSLSEMRLMSQSPLRYRRQILAFKHRFTARGCTVLMLDDRSSGADSQVQSIVHGVLCMQVVPLKFGINRRFLSVTKMRGSAFREGNHDYAIKPGGIVIFPRLVAAEQHQPRLPKETFRSGNAELDKLTGGGLHSGTSNLFMGPAGSGKSTIAAMYASNAAAAGHGVLYLAFDEVLGLLVDRAREVGLEFDSAIAAGKLQVRQVDPAEVAPGELANDIVKAVDEGVRVVVLDSLNGYVNAMPQEDFLHLHLHELLTYLNQRGVMTIMILAQSGLVGPMGTPVDVSYLADTVMLMRFFEALGALKKALSVVKKRSGPHEATIRALEMTSKGIVVGPPLLNFQGVLTGVPQILGGARSEAGTEYTGVS